MNSANEQLTREIHNAFSAGNYEKVMEKLNDNVEVHAYAMNATMHGKEGFMAFMQGFKSAFPDVAITHKNIVSDGNTVAVEFIGKGTHTGDFVTPNGTIPATGRPVSFTVSEFHTWENGLLTRLTNYQDSGALMAQITG